MRLFELANTVHLRRVLVDLTHVLPPDWKLKRLTDQKYVVMDGDQLRLEILLRTNNTIDLTIHHAPQEPAEDKILHVIKQYGGSIHSLAQNRATYSIPAKFVENFKAA